MPSFRRALPLLFVLAPSVALAQSPARTHALRVAIDNDILAMRLGKPDDHDYTHGTRLSLASTGAPGWMLRLAGALPDCRVEAARPTGCVASAFEVGQEIYTPRVESANPIPGERPYSGWLYAAPRISHVLGSRVRTLRLVVGVTGPASFAEEAQDGMHALLGERQRPGWNNQLRSEVGLALGYDERLGLERALGSRGVGALSLGWGAMAGNVRTAAHLGLLARVGTRSALPWSPEEPEWTTATRFYAIGGLRQELVVRSLFIDGNTFHESPSADRIPFVHEVMLGGGVREGRWSLEYRWVRRSREYEAQLKPHAWGSVGIGVEW